MRAFVCVCVRVCACVCMLAYTCVCIHVRVCARSIRKDGNLILFVDLGYLSVHSCLYRPP